jgi:hypothetical protein
MTHRARTTLAAISLVLCVISAAACVVSYAEPVGITSRHNPRASGEILGFYQVRLLIVGGRAYLGRTVFTRTDRRTHVYDNSPHRFRVSVVREGWIVTVTWLPYPDPALLGMGNAESRQWMVSIWLLVLLFAMLPIRWAILRRRERRRNNAGVCVRCGYDLRGSNSGRCSECGEPIPLHPYRV